MANVFVYSEWIFPDENAIIQNNIVPHTIIDHTFVLPHGNLETPLSLFIRASELSVNMTTTRFAQAGLEVNWDNARIMTQMEYGEFNIGTGFMYLANHIASFDHYMNGLESFDIVYFRAQLQVIVKITLSFAYRIIPIIEGPRIRALRRNHVNYNGLQVVGGRQVAANNLRFGAPFNPNRPQTTLRGYHEMKKKMFHNRTLNDFFTYTKSVLEVPHTENGFCFPMAFLKCQLRILLMEDDVEEIQAKKSIKELEETGNTDWMTAHDEFDPYICPALRQNGLERDFFTREDDCRFYPFNPYKQLKQRHPDQFDEYAKTTEEYNIDWYLAATDLHAQVENHFNREIDHTNQDLVCNLYGRFFHTHIHLYSLAGSGSRFATYIEDNDRHYKRHIHILVDGLHCSAITHVRNFSLSTKSSGKMSLHNFCDICTYTTCDSTNKVKMVEHIRKCEQENLGCTNISLTKFSQDVSKDLRQRKLFSSEIQGSCEQCGVVNGKLSKTCLREHECVKGFIKRCLSCRFEVPEEEIGTHRCYIQIPEIKPPVASETVFCYDIEARIEPVGEKVKPKSRINALNIWKHSVIKVLFMSVYGEQKMIFQTLDEFCEFLMNDPILDDSVIYAHNGGGYDHQYLLTYCELHSVPHTITPHAASKHKFLCLEVVAKTGKTRKFKDTIALIPGALKRIGQDFGFEVVKGDFPHLFSVEENLDYEGSFPRLEYFSPETKKTAEDRLEIEEHVATESVKFCQCNGRSTLGHPGDPLCLVCHMPPWRFQEQLTLYCRLDTEILRGIFKNYRDQIMTPGLPEDECFNWNYPGMDPCNLLTQSQIAITGFLNGIQTPVLLASAQYSLREGYNQKSNNWLHRLEAFTHQTIIYKGNSIKEWYDEVLDSFFTGYCEATRTVYMFFDCCHEMCIMCHPANELCGHCKSVDGFHPRRNMKREVAQRQRRQQQSSLEKRGYSVQYIWEHEFDGHMLGELWKEDRVMNDRDFFFGGRTEVFSCYARSTVDRTIFYHDVCSLYPTVCANKELPIGFPTILYGRDIVKERLHYQHPDRYWGFALIRILPRKDDMLGLLPSRAEGSGRLQFTVEEQVGCWHTEEIYLAQEQGYIVLEVIQVYHWDDQSRSSTLMRGYVSYYLRMKQEAEGWKKAGASSETPSPEEQETIIESLFQKNGGIGRMRAALVCKSPVKRAIAKLMLNCLWGKFVQKKQEEYHVTINGYKQYMFVLGHPDVDIEKARFRHVKDNIFKISLHKRVGYEMCSNKYNIWIGASVTAHARCILHRKLIAIGEENAIYCDTDSVKGLHYRNNRVPTGIGLGSWVDEHPNEEIESVHSFAPKCYNDRINGINHTKGKGVVITVENQELLNEYLLMDKMIVSVFFYNHQPTDKDSVTLKNFTISSNSKYPQLPYGSMLSTHNDKVLRPMITKRQIIRYFGPTEDKTLADFERVYTVPWGYVRDLDHEKELSQRFYHYVI